MASRAMTAAFAAILACAIAPMAAAQGQPGQTYSSLAPPELVVALAYNISGTVSTPAPCTNSWSNSTCLPQVQAASSSIIITYSVNTTYTVNATSTVTLKACYSPASTVNRAWRKPNDVIALDKQCTVAIATGLPAQGQYVYKPGPNTAPGTYNILALASCSGAYCAMGKSPGFYQINEINSRPSWLLTASGIFAAIGPTCLLLFFVGEQYLKKRQ